MGSPRPGLGTKLALALVGGMAVLLTAFGLVYDRLSRAGQERVFILTEDRLGDMIRRATRTAMLRNDREDLALTLLEIGRESQVERVRIYDKKGEIRYSSRPQEVGEQVDMSADACDRCHATAEPLTRLDRRERTRIYRSGGHRVMGTIHPIPNEPDCSSAECHVHGAEQAVLGVLDVQMSLASIDQFSRNWSRSFLGWAVLTLLGVSAFSFFLVRHSVNRPVRELVAATRAISAGDLDQRVSDRFDSELSELVRSFNQMTRDLQEARRESQEWARTLEHRVQEKSEALRRAQDEMVQVEKMASLGKLAAVVAHEINNPLAGIRTFARLLLKKSRRAGPAPEAPGAPAADAAASLTGTSLPPSDEESREWLARIESEAGRCGEIVRNLLAFSRGSSPRTAPADLNEIVGQSVRLVQHQLDLASIGTRLDLAADLPAVECDAQQMKQALLTMLINACEAMPQGGELWIETSTAVARTSPARDRGGASGPADGVEIRIRDTGLGMDEETRKHIFEPFFTTKEGSAVSGTGLGLAVAYNIVRSHGGNLSVESAPGAGSTFIVKLPLSRLGAMSEGDFA